MLYCYPERITDELLDVMAAEEKIVKYLDIPIQHCDGEILRRMYRPGNETMLRNLIAKIREKMPDVTNHIDRWLPRRNERAVQRSGGFRAGVQFDRLGCFAYSEEGNRRCRIRKTRLMKTGTSGRNPDAATVQIPHAEKMRKNRHYK